MRRLPGQLQFLHDASVSTDASEVVRVKAIAPGKNIMAAGIIPSLLLTYDSAPTSAWAMSAVH